MELSFWIGAHLGGPVAEEQQKLFGIEKLNIQPIAKMLSYAVCGVEPKHMGPDVKMAKKNVITIAIIEIKIAIAMINMINSLVYSLTSASSISEMIAHLTSVIFKGLNALKTLLPR